MSSISELPAIFKRCSLLPLENLLDAVIKVTEADFGNLQLVDPASGGLKIVAQRGFDHRFLDFFACVTDESSACGAAMKRKRLVVVSDITKDPIFNGRGEKTTLEVLLSSRVRAVCSTPFFNSAGEMIGMISAHYRQPMTPSAEMLVRQNLMVKCAVQLAECANRQRNGHDRPKGAKSNGSEYPEGAAVLSVRNMVWQLGCNKTWRA